MAPLLEFFVYIGSTYSHLSVARASAVAAEGGVDLRWTPFSARTLMREQNNLPFNGKPVKLKYMWRDVERRAMRFNVPFDGIPPYPVGKTEIANHVATLASVEGWCPQFTQAAYKKWFLEKKDPGEFEVLEALIASIGQDPERVLKAAQAQECLDTYDRRTCRARELGVFGSPTFVHGTEVFWGDDRLEDAIQWAIAHSAA
jgi:2-hydroxychromene-2-carboxylate isomerase